MSGPAVVVVAHPHARGAPPAVRDELVRAWRAVGDVEVCLTTSAGEGARLARAAARGGARVVVAVGGDGTYNSVASGLQGSATAFAPVPAGSTNVLPRALGLPNDARAASRALAAAVRHGVEVRLPLSHAGGQVFLANAGMGFDADVVRLAEAHVRLKRRSGPAAFLWATARALAAPRRHLRFHVDGAAEPVHAEMLSVQNVSPYTFLGPKALAVTPQRGVLDRFTVLVLPRVTIRSLAEVLSGALRDGLADVGTAEAARRLRPFVLRGVSRLDVHAETAVALQVDGEPVPPARAISFVHRASSVRVFLPSAPAGRAAGQRT